MLFTFELKSELCLQKEAYIQRDLQKFRLQFLFGFYCVEVADWTPEL